MVQPGCSGDLECRLANPIQPTWRSHPRTIIAGDWNQTIPRSTQPYEMAELLETRHSIDHLAHSPDLIATSVTAWSARDSQLGDRFGVHVHLGAR